MQGVVPVRTRRSSSVDQRRFDDLVQAGSPSLLRTRFIGNALVRHSGLLENEEVPVPESAREGEGMVLDVTCTATKRWKDGANKSTTSTQPSPRPAIIVGSTTSNIVAQLSVDEDSESDEEGTMKAGVPSPLTFEQKLSRIYDSRTGQSLKRSRRVEKNENVQLGLLDEEHSHAHAVTEYREFSEAELKKNPQLRRLQTVYRRMNLAETIIRNSFVSANRKVRTDEQRAEELLKLEKAKLILFLGRKYNIEERIDEIIGTIAAQKTSGRGYPDASTAQNTTRRQVTLPPIAPEISRAEISARCQEITNGVKAANSDFYHLNTVDDFKVKALRRLTNVLDDRQDRAKDLAQVCGVDIHASKREDVLESRSNYKDMSWLIESLDLAFTGIDDGVFADSAKVSEALMLALKGRTRTSPSVPDGPIAPSRPSPDVAEQKSARTEPSTSFFLTAGAASPSTAAMSAAQRVSEEISTALHSIHDPSIVGFSVLDEAETVPLMKREAIGLNLLEFMLDAIPDTLVDEVRSQKAAAVASEAQDDDAIIASAATPSSHAPASARSRATRSAQTRPATAVSPSGTLAEMKSSGSDGGPPGGEMEPAFSSGADSASSFDEVSLVADREMQPFAPPPRKLRNLREDLIPDLLRLYEMYDYDQLIERRRQGDRDRQKQSEEQMVADMEARVRDYRNRVQLPDGDDDIDLNNMGKKRPSAVSLSHHSPTRAETERSFATSKDGEPKPTSQPALSAAPVTEPVVLMEEVSEDTGERVLLREELTCGLVFTIIGQMSQADTAKAMAGMLKISKKKPLHFVKYYVRVTNKRDDTACIGTIQTIASKLKNLKANPLPGLYQSGMASKTIVNAGVTKNLMCLMPIKKKGKCSFENGFVFTGEVTDRHDDGETASLFTGEDGRTPSRGGIMSSGGLMGASTAGGRLGGGFGSAGAKHGSKARSGESAHLTPSSLDDRMRGYTLGSKDDDQCSDYSDDAEKFASIPLPDELGWMSKVNRDEMNLSGSPKPNFSPLQGSPSGKGFEGSQKSLLDLVTPPKSAPSTRTGTAAFDAARASAGSGFKHPGEWGLMDPMHSAAEILAKNSILHSALLSGDSMSWSSKEGQAIQDALLQGTDISNMSAEEVASLLMQRLSELEGELSDGTFLDANGRPISAAFRARDSKDALDSQDKSSGLHAQPLRKRSSRRLVNPGSQPAPLFVITSSMSGDGLTAQQAQEYDNSSVAKFDLFDHSSHHGSLARTRSVASMSPGVIGKDGEFLEGSRSRTNSMYLAKSTGSSHGMSERERKREMEERLAAIEAQYNCEIVADQTIPLDQIRKTEQTKGGGASGKQPIKGVTTGASIKYSVEEELPTQLQLDQLVSKMPGVVLKRSADTGKTAVFLPMGAESASLLNAVTNKPKQKPGSRQRSGGESRDESAKSKAASTASKKKKADSKRSTTACFTGEADLAQSDDDRATEIFNRSTAGGVPHDPCAGRITNLLRSAATSVTSNIRAAGVSLSGASRSRTAVTEMDMMEEQARELYLQDPVRYDAVVDDLVRMALSQLNSSHEDSKNQSVTQLINIIRSDDNYPSTSSSHPPTYGIPTPEIGCATPSSMRSHDSRPPMRPRPAGQYTRPVGGGAGTERRLHDALPPDRGQRILTNYYRRGTGESGSMDQPRGSFDEMGNFINYEEDPLHGPLPLPTISKRGNGAPEVDIMTGRIVGEDPSGKEEGGARGGSIVYPLRGSQTGGPIVGEAPWAMGRVSDELAHHHQHSSEIIRDGDGSRRSQAQMGSYGFGADQLAEPSSPSDITLPQLRVNSIVDVDPASPLFSLLKVSASQDMHAAKKEDGENEVERILYEQMKAQLVLRTILQQMRALWARKQRETEEKKRDMMKRTFARAMELSWEIERGRVINLNKLINILDRRTGRVRGFIPYYNDENVLTGGRNPNVCPRFFLRDPRFTKSKPHLMAKRRRLLPIHLMREGSNLEEPNPHLMYGYTRHLLSQDEMDGIDPESIWVRRPKFSLKHPISYKDMRTTGERLRYRRRLQQAAPFQHPTLMQSPHPRNESHCPPYGKRG